MTRLTVIYKAEDGSDFPVEWSTESDMSSTWRLWSEYAPLPAYPVERSASDLRDAGLLLAISEVGLDDLPAVTRGSIWPNSWWYRRIGAPTPEEQATTRHAVQALDERFGGSIGLWEKHCRPRMQHACEVIDAAMNPADLSAAFEASGIALAQTVIASLSNNAHLARLTSFLREELGLEGEGFAADLSGGFSNVTLDAGEELWQIAQLLKPLLGPADATVEGLLRLLEENNELAMRFSAIQEKFGGRTQEWQIGSPTWREQPEIPLGMIASMVNNDAGSPYLTLAETAGRRDLLLSELSLRLSSKPGKPESLAALASALSTYIAVKEERVFWQLTMFGCLRRAILRIGNRLAADALITRASDAFFLTVEEMNGSGGAAFTDVVESRKAEWAKWSRVKPPRTIGATPRAANANESGLSIKGLGASKGRVTGKARVLTSPAEADRLGRGEILVCLMTSPTWTPLFAIAGGVVTETGGILSHPSIAAREYGIPCVVGVQGATTLIRDGADITVDGTLGTVQLEDDAPAAPS